MTDIGEYVVKRIVIGAIAIMMAMILYVEYLVLAVLGGVILYLGGAWAINHPELVVQYVTWAVAGLAACGAVLYVIGEVAVRVFDIDPEKHGDDGELKEAQ